MTKKTEQDDVVLTPDKEDALSTIAEALLEIGETLESILAFMQEREEAFKARAARASGFDRKPRAPYRGRDDSNDEGGEGGSYERKPYSPRKSYGDKPAYGEKKSYGPKKSYGDKKPYTPRGRGDGDSAAPRKKYKGGY